MAFYIPVAKNKPVYYNVQSNTFIRKGSADQRATKEEIDTLYRDQTFGTKTSETATSTSIKDLNHKSIREYMDYMSRFNPNVSYNRMSTEDVLTKLRVIDLDTDACTFAGLLFFGKRIAIEKFFPDFKIDLLEVPGTSYKDASSRYSFRLQEDDYENLWEAYFECFKRLRKEVDVNFQLTADGFGEELSPGLKSIREGLVNMLMHVDYFSPAHPRIRIFTNHIEYFNPGGFPKPIEELKGKDLSIPRNPILAKLFRMVKLAENAGYGLDNIESNWKENNGSTVEFSLDFDATIVKFHTVTERENKENDGAITDRLRNDYGTIKEGLRNDYGINTEEIRGKYGIGVETTLISIFQNPEFSAEQLATHTNRSASTIEKHTAKLKKENIIKRIGPKLGGRWEIVKENKAV